MENALSATGGIAASRASSYDDASGREDQMPSEVTIDLVVPGVALGWVVAEGCSVGPSSGELLAEIRAATARALASQDWPAREARRGANRDLLRFGTYKPTGRGKPASEYLVNAAIGRSFPLINALVDINNLVSLDTLLPISLVDLDRAGTDSFKCRRGHEGEAYVFNPSGQVLELRDLLLLARLPADEPCASPIKDSQATKTHEGTARVLGVVYAPSPMADEAGAAAQRMGDLMSRFCGAATMAGQLSRE